MAAAPRIVAYTHHSFPDVLPIRTAAIKASSHSTRLSRLLTGRNLQMSNPRWRWSLIGIWLAVTGITFIAIDSMAVRSWLLLLVFGVIPPAMLLWAWNEDRPLPIGSLHGQRKQR